MSLRFKRHYKLLVALALVSAVLILGLGDQRILAYTAPGNEQVVQGLTTLARWLTEDLLGQQVPLALGTLGSKVPQAWYPGLLDLLPH